MSTTEYVLQGMWKSSRVASEANGSKEIERYAGVVRRPTVSSTTPSNANETIAPCPTKVPCPKCRHGHGPQGRSPASDYCWNEETRIRFRSVCLWLPGKPAVCYLPRRSEVIGECQSIYSTKRRRPHVTWNHSSHHY